MKKHYLSLVIALILSVILSACTTKIGMPTTEEPTQMPITTALDNTIQAPTTATLDNTTHIPLPTTVTLDNTFTTSLHPSFMFDYSNDWEITQNDVNQYGETVSLKNERGVTITFSHLSGSITGGGSAVSMSRVDVSKVVDLNLLPSSVEVIDYSNLGKFMVAKLKITGMLDMKTDSDFKDVDGSTAYAVIPVSRIGTDSVNKPYMSEYSFAYSGNISFISNAPDGKFTKTEEQDVIAILSSFKVSDTATEETTIYKALQNGDFSRFAGKYKPFGIYDEMYGGGKKLPDLILQKNGVVTGGLVYSSYPTTKPTAVTLNEDGSYLCQVSYSSDTVQKYFVIYPEGVIGENPYVYNDPFLTKTLYIHYFSFDGGVSDIIYYKIED